MASDSSRRSLSPSEYGGPFAEIKPTHLAIACTRFPKLFHNFTPFHIAAILIHTGQFTPSFPDRATTITAPIILDQTNELMQRAFAYGKYNNALKLPEKLGMDIPDHFSALGWEASIGMSLEEFTECVTSWKFMQKLENDGVEGRKRLLKFGWMLYERVPIDVKIRVGLVKKGDQKGPGWEQRSIIKYRIELREGNDWTNCCLYHVCYTE